MSKLENEYFAEKEAFDTQLHIITVIVYGPKSPANNGQWVVREMIDSDLNIKDFWYAEVKNKFGAYKIVVWNKRSGPIITALDVWKPMSTSEIWRIEAYQTGFIGGDFDAEYVASDRFDKEKEPKEYKKYLAKVRRNHDQIEEDGRYWLAPIWGKEIPESKPELLYKEEIPF